jgi:DNA topoisomerase I
MAGSRGVQAGRRPPAEGRRTLSAPLAGTDLVYVDDREPGIVRRRQGRGFAYVDASGRRVDAAPDLRRIRALAIPPAWVEVWICPDPRGHIQATGRDARGRKQYRYHPAWESRRSVLKFDALAEFGERLPRIRQRLREDLGRRGMVRERVLAAVVDLLDRTLVRIGGDAYARTNNSFGLATLRREHASVDGSAIRLAFTGKSGKSWNVRLADRRLARVMRRCQELPGQRLFKYVSEDGSTAAVGSGDVNAYLAELSGARITSKHFRTWAATVLAANLLATEPAPTSKRGLARTVNAALDQVAARLGNTRTICRRSYVHPAVVERFAAGTLAAELDQAARRSRRPLEGLTPEEARVLPWLRKASSVVTGRPPVGAAA